MKCVSFFVSIYVYNYKAVRTVVSRKSEPKMRNTGGVFVMTVTSDESLKNWS